MSKGKVLVAVLCVVGLAVMVGGIRYIHAAAGKANPNLTLENIGKIRERMEFSDVMKVLDQPDSRTFMSDGGGPDAGTFKAVWNSGPNQPSMKVVIDFNGFCVSRLEVNGKPRPLALLGASSPTPPPMPAKVADRGQGSGHTSAKFMPR